MCYPVQTFLGFFSKTFCLVEFGDFVCLRIFGGGGGGRGEFLVFVLFLDTNLFYRASCPQPGS